MSRRKDRLRRQWGPDQNGYCLFCCEPDTEENPPLTLHHLVRKERMGLFDYMPVHGNAHTSTDNEELWNCHDYVERMEEEDARLVYEGNSLTLAQRGVTPNKSLLREYCGSWQTFHDRLVKGDFEEYGLTELDL